MPTGKYESTGAEDVDVEERDEGGIKLEPASLVTNDES